MKTENENHMEIPELKNIIPEMIKENHQMELIADSRQYKRKAQRT